MCRRKSVWAQFASALAEQLPAMRSKRSFPDYKTLRWSNFQFPLNSFKREITTCFTDSTAKVLLLLVAWTSPVPIPASGEPQFSVDVHNVDSGRDCFGEIFVGCSGTAMQCQKDTARSLDATDSLNIQSLASFPAHHALQHAVHIAHCRGQHIDSRKLNELSRFIGRSEARG